MLIASFGARHLIILFSIKIVRLTISLSWWAYSVSIIWYGVIIIKTLASIHILNQFGARHLIISLFSIKIVRLTISLTWRAYSVSIIWYGVIIIKTLAFIHILNHIGARHLIISLFSIKIVRLTISLTWRAYSVSIIWYGVIIIKTLAFIHILNHRTQIVFCIRGLFNGWSCYFLWFSDWNEKWHSHLFLCSEFNVIIMS